jgi:hypothetical protein
VVFYWSEHNFSGIRNVLPAVLGASLMVVGAQNALGGFLLAIGAGHEAEFLKSTEPVAPARPAQAGRRVA